MRWQVSNADAVSSFLGKGADVNYQDPRKGYTGLHWVSGALRRLPVLPDHRTDLRRIAPEV